MKRLVSMIIPALICGMAFMAGCAKQNPNSDGFGHIIGCWTHPVYEDNADGKLIVHYKRSKTLPPDSEGIKFLKDGTLIERKNAGECGTPPISYADFSGEWQIHNKNEMEIDVAYWGGMEHRIFKIIDVTYSTLKIEVISRETDINYPTTIHRLSEETLMRMRNDFAHRNPTVVSSLNQFGFCGWGDDLLNVDVSSGSFTEEEAIETVRKFVARNPETGITNSENLHFIRISRGPSSTSSNSWVFTTESQIINDIEVYNTNIAFNIQNRALRFCTGHYYPNIYVPEKFNFAVERAKSKLLGKEVVHLGWAGQYSLGKIKAEHLQKGITNLIIVPLITEEKIELRVAWKIYLAPLHYIFYVDVMTGKIIQEEPTIIA